VDSALIFSCIQKARLQPSEIHSSERKVVVVSAGGPAGRRKLLQIQIPLRYCQRAQAKILSHNSRAKQSNDWWWNGDVVPFQLELVMSNKLWVTVAEK